MDAVNPERVGTKAAAWYAWTIAPGATETAWLRLSPERSAAPFADAETVFQERIAAADRLYAALAGGQLSADEALVQRQALAGLIWTKQYYGYDVTEWLRGDPAGPAPPEARKHGRNRDWRHLSNGDVISMPDKWEYPWYAAWDLAFHTVAFGLVDPVFAKDQLLLMLQSATCTRTASSRPTNGPLATLTRPSTSSPRGRCPDEQRMTGEVDREFLARIFHKLLLNFTWWVNRKDADGTNVFEGGFLGLDNIGVIDRSTALPAGMRLEQSDGTAWMATYCLGMGWIALQLAAEDPAYEDLIVTFFEHFMAIGGALNGLSEGAQTLWDEEDGFYYDALRLPDGRSVLMKVRSLVGLLPIVPAFPVSADMRDRVPSFTAHARRYIERHPELAGLATVPGTSPTARWGC